MSEAENLRGYMPIVVRAATTKPEDRKFAASIIAQERRGRAVTERQVYRMRRIVERFKDLQMRDDE